MVFETCWAVAMLCRCGGGCGLCQMYRGSVLCAPRLLHRVFTAHQDVAAAAGRMRVHVAADERYVIPCVCMYDVPFGGAGCMEKASAPAATGGDCRDCDVSRSGHTNKAQALLRVLAPEKPIPCAAASARSGAGVLLRGCTLWHAMAQVPSAEMRGG